MVFLSGKDEVLSLEDLDGEVLSLQMSMASTSVPRDVKSSSMNCHQGPDGCTTCSLSPRLLHKQ